jgi:hypothetical protein
LIEILETLDFLLFSFNRDGTIVGQLNTAQHERSLESAATEFQRRFHISADDLESNRSSRSLSQVAILFFYRACYGWNHWILFLPTFNIKTELEKTTFPQNILLLI